LGLLQELTRENFSHYQMDEICMEIQQLFSKHRNKLDHIVPKLKEIAGNQPMQVHAWILIQLRHQPEHAMKYFNQMSESGYTPDLACWEALIRCLGNTGRVMEMKQYLQLMENQGVVMDTNIAISALRGFIINRKTDDVVTVLNHVQQHRIEMNFSAASWISVFLIEHRRDNDVELMYYQLREQGYKPTDQYFYTIITNYVAQKNELMATQWIERIMESGISVRADVYIRLLEFISLRKFKNNFISVVNIAEQDTALAMNEDLHLGILLGYYRLKLMDELKKHLQHIKDTIDPYKYKLFWTKLEQEIEEIKGR